MKILLVHVSPVHKYPPVISIMQSLRDLGHEVHLISLNISDTIKMFCDEQNIGVIDIKMKFNFQNSVAIKFFGMLRIKKLIWEYIEKLYDKNSLIWVFDNTIKFLGKKLLNMNYVVHFFELHDELRYYNKLPIIKINERKLCEKAQKVIHCEYNRAFITMVNWRLNKLPVVIPNKPYYRISFKRNSEITNSTFAKNIMKKLKGKKIILYQGVLSQERPLVEYIKAVEKLGDDYAFVVMSESDNIYKDLNAKNYYFIPFINPPFHLEITSHAHIGVLSYYPTYNSINSPLNAIYCAPNKLYEYSMFGIPMIGNNIPGLTIPFEKFKCGININEIKADQIINAILDIEKEYDNMSINSRELYESVDIKNIIRNEVLNME